MFGLGFSELLFLGLIVLIFIGPKELPTVARAIGRFLNELKRGSDSFKREFKFDDIQSGLRIEKPNIGKILTEASNLNAQPKPTSEAEVSHSKDRP